MNEDSTLDVLVELKRSFYQDKKRVQNEIVEIETAIKQCEEYIVSMNKKDNPDYNMFSPRIAGNVYSDMIAAKKAEIADYEEKLRSAYKKLSNLTHKQDLLDELNSVDIEEIESGKKKNKKAVNKYGEANSDYSDANSDFLKLQNEDRQRIAAQLHDTVLQNLSLVIHNLELSSKFIDCDPVRAKLEIENNSVLIKESIDEIRNTIFDLRPVQFGNDGFKKTMENLILNLSTKTSMTIKSSFCELEDLDNIYLVTIYRAVNELVLNSVKHSEGTLINVSVSKTKRKITVSVVDDGIGYDAEKCNLENHYGLKILSERIGMLGGSIKNDSKQDGTAVVITVPIK